MLILIRGYVIGCRMFCCRWLVICRYRGCCIGFLVFLVFIVLMCMCSSGWMN